MKSIISRNGIDCPDALRALLGRRLVPSKVVLKDLVVPAGLDSSNPFAEKVDAPGSRSSNLFGRLQPSLCSVLCCYHVRS